MPKFEYRVYQVMALWDAGAYRLAAKVRKSDDWEDVDRLGDVGWEFVAFLPNSEAYLSGTIPPEQLRVIQLAVFKRRLEEKVGEETVDQL